MCRQCHSDLIGTLHGEGKLLPLITLSENLAGRLTDALPVILDGAMRVVGIQVLISPARDTHIGHRNHAWLYRPGLAVLSHPRCTGSYSIEAIISHMLTTLHYV